MKRILIASLLNLLLFGFVFAQNYNWIVPNKDYLKMYVISDGIYRINKSDFLNAGINPNNIDPRTVKVLYKGLQIPIYFFGEEDGVFNDSDYFDFYGQRNYGGISNVYKDSSGFLLVHYVVDEYYNLYSDTNIYWIDWGGSFGLRFNDFSYSVDINYPNDYFYQELHFEKDLIYSLGEKRNPSDFRNFNNERISGEGWYWRDFTRGNFLSDTFRTPYLSQTTSTSYIKLFAYPNSYTDTIFNEHRLILRINANIVDTLKRDNYNRFDTLISFSTSLLSSSSVNQIIFTYTNPSTYIGRLYFDMFHVYYPRKMVIEGNYVSINLTGNDTTTKKFRIVGGNSNLPISIYDVKNNFRITNYFFSSDTIIFSGKSNGKFEINNQYITNKPLRIKIKRVPNFISSQNGADYLIIYNKLFESQAEQLRMHRSLFNQFRTYKAEIEDVYDVFNFGIENPVAIRNFVKYVYTNWQLPKLRFLCLFGRGSLDPKHNVVNNSYYKNYIPVYGNPLTDGYFVNFNDGSVTYYHQVAVGRLPVYTIQEAQDIVNKIIDYDNTSLAKWIKNFIFITGGQNISEQIQFANQSNAFINSYITPCPISGVNTKIYRNDSAGYITYNYQDSIKNSINSGGLIVNYIGHAGSNVWDNGLSDPSELNNAGKLPYIFSMTCFTGKNAETEFRSFGEKFITVPSKGAIGFLGSTGWSFSGSGNNLNGYLFEGFSIDSLRTLGELLKYSTIRMSVDSMSFPSRNTLNCYILLGDPASELKLTKYPEFDIQTSDFWSSNLYPSLKELISFKIFPKNIGTCADSCKIKFQILDNNKEVYRKDTVIRNFYYLDTLSYRYTFDSAGNYSIKVVVDPDNWYPKDSKTNNTIIIPIYLKNISFVPLKPVDNQIIYTDSLDIVGLNPNIKFGTNQVKVILAVDTSKYFSSPMNRIFFKNITSGVITKFKIDIPIKDTNVIYYWRLNCVINNTDSSGWSEIRRFIWNTNKIFDNRKTSDTIIKISKYKKEQYENFELNNITFRNGKFELDQFTGNLVAQSWGGNFFDATYFTVNELQIFLIDTIFWGGLNIAKVRKLDGKLTELKHFTYSSSLSNDSLLNYLNNFDTNYVLMVVKAIPTSETKNMNAAVRNKFKQFGSYYVDSVNLTQFSRWSFISYRGLPQPLVAEGYMIAGWTPVNVSMNPQFYFTWGQLFNTFGPANEWKNFNFIYNIFPSTYIKYDLIGVKNDGSEIFLKQNQNITWLVNIDSINTLEYPNLKLNLKLEIDTNHPEVNVSPNFSKLNLLYTPAAEIIPDYNSFTKSDSIVQEGDSVSFSLYLTNVGYSPINTIINQWSATSPHGLVKLKEDTIFYNLLVDSSLFINTRLPTKGLRKPTLLQDTIYVLFETKLIGKNEFYSYNNNIVTYILVRGDTVKPDVEVTFDGVKVSNGDFIQRKPRIVLKFFDNSKIFINDTSNIKIKLDYLYIPYYINGVKNPDLDIQFMRDKYLQAIVNYTPTLSDGEHFFEFITTDATGNRGDTIKYFLNVNPEFRITDLTNYPNPMRNYTSFIFNLSGEYPPTECKIKIYSVSGRLIKTINYFANIGFNKVDWDGRDEDGDYIANGVYFYKLIVSGMSKLETKIEKLVVLK
ncbi:MAG: C25 family cysteine peptidase [Ignavibacteria bacterium]|nr:C25 family cysteine peptidase [Ignavibacteria bacterium]